MTWPTGGNRVNINTAASKLVRTRGAASKLVHVRGLHLGRLITILR